MKKYLISALVLVSMSCSAASIVSLLQPKTPDPVISCHSRLIFFKACNFYLPDVVEDYSVYLPIIQKLSEAGLGDVMTFHLSGYGGDAQTLISLANEMRHSPAHIVIIVTAPVYSAHAFLALMGDELHVYSGVFFMFHDVQYGDDADLTSPQLVAMDAVFHSFFNQYIAKYLTKDEIDTIFRSKKNELYISGDELVRRWNK